MVSHQADRNIWAIPNLFFFFLLWIVPLLACRSNNVVNIPIFGSWRQVSSIHSTGNVCGCFGSCSYSGCDHWCVGCYEKSGKARAWHSHSKLVWLLFIDRKLIWVSIEWACSAHFWFTGLKLNCLLLLDCIWGDINMRMWCRLSLVSVLIIQCYFVNDNISFESNFKPTVLPTPSISLMNINFFSTRWSRVFWEVPYITDIRPMMTSKILHDGCVLGNSKCMRMC